MRRRGFWKGFAAGAAAGAGGTLGAMGLASMIGNARRSRVVRVEKSIQVGRPVEEVFRAWASLDWLAHASDLIRDIRVEGNRSHWTMQLDSRRVEWDAEIEQFIPNQAIGWKSINGPKHSGRVTFSPIGNDTLLQITMNYAPPTRLLRPVARPMTWPLEYWVEKALRDFKASLEGKGQEGRRPPMRAERERVGPGTEMTQSDLERATGTLGRPPEATEQRFGGRVTPVDYTRPPEAKS